MKLFIKHIFPAIKNLSKTNVNVIIQWISSFNQLNCFKIFTIKTQIQKYLFILKYKCVLLVEKGILYAEFHEYAEQRSFFVSQRGPIILAQVSKDLTPEYFSQI